MIINDNFPTNRQAVNYHRTTFSHLDALVPRPVQRSDLQWLAF